MSPMEDPWKTSTHRWHYSNSITYETAKGTWYHRVDVEGGHSGKGCNREVMSALDRGQRGSGFSILAGFPASDKDTGILSQCGHQPCFERDPGQDSLLIATNEHFCISVSEHSISKHPQKLQAQVSMAVFCHGVPIKKYSRILCLSFPG